MIAYLLAVEDCQENQSFSGSSIAKHANVLSLYIIYHQLLQTLKGLILSHYQVLPRCWGSRCRRSQGFYAVLNLPNTL
jgi:hypothetical protein